MNWINEWAKWQVIFTYIGLGFLALAILTFAIWFILILISDFYKSHSKKYEWDCRLNEYVKKEDLE